MSVRMTEPLGGHRLRLRQAIWAGVAASVLGLTSATDPVAAYTEKVIYSFCAQANCADGQAPKGDLAMDSRGNLFGTAGGGGDSQGDGVVFELIRKHRT